MHFFQIFVNEILYDSIRTKWIRQDPRDDTLLYDTIMIGKMSWISKACFIQSKPKIIADCQSKGIMGYHAVKR